jgi:hypothetical protein
LAFSNSMRFYFVFNFFCCEDVEWRKNSSVWCPALEFYFILWTFSFLCVLGGVVAVACVRFVFFCTFSFFSRENAECVVVMCGCEGEC